MILPTQEFIDRFKKTQGAISVCESIAIMNIASQAPKGIYMELGGNAGKAAMSAAYGLQPGAFMLVDPIYDLKNIEAFTHSVQGHPDNMGWDYAREPDFKQKVMQRIQFASNNQVIPVLLGDYSENAIQKYDKYSYVFVDADNHEHDLVFAEIGLLKDRMIEGGIIAFHDFGNQYHAPREAHQHLISSCGFENIEIDWKTIFDYVREGNLEDGNDSWHTQGSEEFPKFVGACRKL